MNLMKMCTGTIETFNSYCGRFHSTNIFLLNCLLSSIELTKTFDDDVDNTSDHLPIQLKLCYTVTVFRHVMKAPMKIKIENTLVKIPCETINIINHPYSLIWKKLARTVLLTLWPL